MKIQQLPSASALILALLISYFNSQAQNMAFSMPHAAASYYNPAFTGILERPRLSYQIRNQWSQKFVSHLLGYEQEIKSINSSLGAQVFFDKSNGLIDYRINLLYSYKINLSENLAVRAGISAGVITKRLDTTVLIFNDPEPLADLTVTKPNFSAGMLIQHRRFHAGFAMHNITRPDISFLGGSSKLSIRSSVFAGGIFPIGDEESGWIMNPYILAQNQDHASMIQPGFAIAKGMFSGGLLFVIFHQQI